MKNKLKNIGMFLLTAMVVVVLGACSSDSGNEATNNEDQVLRVATMPFLTSLPTRIIEEYDLDEKHGFEMETIMFATGAPMSEALAANEWDVGAMGAAAVTGMANYDMLIIGEVLESTDGLGVFTKPDSEIVNVTNTNPDFPNVLGDAETVRGKTISLPVATAQHFTTLKWLEAIGLEADEVSIVNMETAQAYQSLIADEVQLTALNVPTFFQAKDDGMVEVGNLADLGTAYVDMIVANRATVDANPELLQKYIEALYEANDIIESDKAAAAELMHEWLTEVGSETTVENNLSDLERANFFSREQISERVDEGVMGNFARELGAFYVEQGQLEESALDSFETNVLTEFVE